jgi:hypothetical protein
VTTFTSTGKPNGKMIDMKLLAIDPGTDSSGYVIWDGHSILEKGFVDNSTLLDMLRHYPVELCGKQYRDNVCAMQSEQGNKNGGRIQVAVEMIQSFGMPVGRETFSTCLVVGRVIEICHTKTMPCLLIFRQDVKQYLCHSARAKDSNIRQAIIDLLGPPGTKKSPGVTYGISKHLWSALAVALTAEAKINSAQAEARAVTGCSTV